MKVFVDKRGGVPFLHANVYKDLGDICHPLLEKGQKSTKFTYVLKKLKDLLYEPNFSNAANITLSKLRFENPQEYLRQIEENANLL